MYSKTEEILNAISHAIGTILSIVALVIMIIYSSSLSPLHIVTVTIFGASLILLYLASTIYHSVTKEKLKMICKKIDHLSIYILIAGTYTPIVLLGLKGAWGWSLFGIIWALAVLGFIFKFSKYQKNEKISLILYAAMGWLILIAIKPMSERLSTELIWYIALGGIFYTVGILFYAVKKIPYNHFIWHLFVLGGSIMHFFGIFFYLIKYQ